MDLVVGFAAAVAVVAIAFGLITIHVRRETVMPSIMYDRSCFHKVVSASRVPTSAGEALRGNC